MISAQVIAQIVDAGVNLETMAVVLISQNLWISNFLWQRSICLQDQSQDFVETRQVERRIVATVSMQNFQLSPLQQPQQPQQLQQPQHQQAQQQVCGMTNTQISVNQE